MRFTWKDYLATSFLLILVFSLSYSFIRFTFPISRRLPIELRGIVTVFVFATLFIVSLSVYAKILRTIVPPKNSVFSANERSLACFVWKQTVFTYEWTASILAFVTPVLLRPVLYKMLGARIGKGALLAGMIVEPQMVTIGNYSNIGGMAFIMAHAIVKDGVILKHITIGNYVAIGAHAVIMPGVEIGDGSIVGAGAIVLTDTKIPPNEVWGGVPAKKIKDVEVKNAAGKE
jgi:serine acetyltransferase